MFIDTHCHLDYLKNIDEVIAKSEKEGVGLFIIPTVNKDSIQKSLEISLKHKNVCIGVGLHPIDCIDDENWDNFPQAQVEFINNFLEINKKLIGVKIVGIGETGLDFSFGKTNLNNESIEKVKDCQIRLFKEHINWAKKYELPLIIHNRKGNDLFSDLLKNQNLNGVFHCYASSRKFVKKILDLGFYFGIGGMVTLDEGLQKVVADIPIEKIVLETDSPYLTPKQIRKESSFPNIPANIRFVAETLSKIKGIKIESVEKITNKNSNRLFRI